MTTTSTSDRIGWRDLAERLVWTFVAAATGALAGAPLFDLEPWQAAALAGCAAVVDFVLLVARWRLRVLPSPGEGLPGLRVPDTSTHPSNYPPGDDVADAVADALRNRDGRAR